jgi:hypothetical protein
LHVPLPHAVASQYSEAPHWPPVPVHAFGPPLDDEDEDDELVLPLEDADDELVLPLEDADELAPDDDEPEPPELVLLPSVMSLVVAPPQATTRIDEPNSKASELRMGRTSRRKNPRSGHPVETDAEISV